MSVPLWTRCEKASFRCSIRNSIAEESLNHRLFNHVVDSKRCFSIRVTKQQGRSKRWTTRDGTYLEVLSPLFPFASSPSPCPSRSHCASDQTCMPHVSIFRCRYAYKWQAWVRNAGPEELILFCQKHDTFRSDRLPVSSGEFRFRVEDEAFIGQLPCFVLDQVNSLQGG